MNRRVANVSSNTQQMANGLLKSHDRIIRWNVRKKPCKKIHSLGFSPICIFSKTNDPLKTKQRKNLSQIL